MSEEPERMTMHEFIARQGWDYLTDDQIAAFESGASLRNVVDRVAAY